MGFLWPHRSPQHLHFFRQRGTEGAGTRNLPIAGQKRASEATDGCRTGRAAPISKTQAIRVRDTQPGSFASSAVPIDSACVLTGGAAVTWDQARCRPLACPKPDTAAPGALLLWQKILDTINCM